MNTRPIPTGTAILDIIIFTTIFWMILKRTTGRRNINNPAVGHHRGNWAPGWAYLPVMLIRWAIVPHKDWMCEHRHRQEVMDSQLHNHHHHHYHRHPQDQHHHHNSESYCADSKPQQNVNVMDSFFGQ